MYRVQAQYLPTRVLLCLQQPGKTARSEAVLLDYSPHPSKWVLRFTLTIMKITATKASNLVAIALKARLVPILHGSPGIGKSSIAREVAKTFNLKLIDVRLAQCDPTDLLGFPRIEGNKGGYIPMDTFPIEGDPIPSGYAGWLILFDELTSAAPSIQAASYKIILDRMVGNHKLHKNVAMMAAGNLETDGAIVQPMSTALQSRLIHLEVRSDAKEWNDYAYTNGYDHRITSYIEFRPDHLYTFSPDHSDKTYASPRTWEFVNDILKVTSITKEVLPLVIGTIGEGVAREFFGFCQIHDKLPKIEQIIQSPNSVPVPTEPSIQFALVGAIAANVTKNNCDSLMDFIKRLPSEFQVVAVRSMIKRKPEIIKAPSFAPWVAKMAKDLL